jgi:glycosyltransferase involved in cell wall biosynthesis
MPERSVVHVVFFAHTSTLYGASRSLLTLIEGLRRDGVACTVILRRPGELIAKLTRVGATAIVAPFELWVSRGERHRAAQRADANRALASRLAAMLPSGDVDLVYTNTSVSPIGALFARAVARPHVWHLREFADADYGFEFDIDPPERRRTFLTADAVIANSRAVRDHHLGGVDPRRVPVVYNGVVWATQLHTAECRATPPPAEPLFAMVGYFTTGKGHLQAIEALHRLRSSHPDARLLIAGDGNAEYEDRCRRRVDELGLTQSVRFVGRVDAPWDVYRAARAVLMCSRREAFGRVTVEAMTVGRAVIAAATGGTPEIVEHETTGLLYDGSVAGLAAAMGRLCEDRALTERLGRQARRRVAEAFTNDRYVSKMRRIIRSCLRT